MQPIQIANGKSHPRRKNNRFFFLYYRRYRHQHHQQSEPKEQKMYVRFFVRKLTLYARVTVDGKRCRNDFSFRVNVRTSKAGLNPVDGEWSNAEQRVLGDSEKAQLVNAKVAYVRDQLFFLAGQMVEKGVRFTADDVKKLFQGQTIRLRDEWGRQRRIEA
jgi:hypothetical protein